VFNFDSNTNFIVFDLTGDGNYGVTMPKITLWRQLIMQYDKLDFYSDDC
jgi:hypothetical protein